MVDGRFLQNGADSGQDYWTVAGEIDLSQAPTGAAPTKPVGGVQGRRPQRAAARPAGQGDGCRLRARRPAGRPAARPHAAPAQPRRDVGDARRGGDPPRRQGRAADPARGQFRRLRQPGRRRGPGGRRRGAAARDLGRTCATSSRRSRKRRGSTASPASTARIGAPPGDAPPKRLVRITVSRPYVAHASMAPSCALAELKDGHLTVWSHGQGMHPLRRNLAAVLGLPIEAITARHLHGAGCYGHNGADDAALDAALIARRLPGRRIRVQWRREEEFGFEPVGPAMLVTLHVDLDERGRPADWTTEIWSGTHVQRPGMGSGYLLASEALADPPPEVKPSRPAGGARRRRHAQRGAALRRAGASHPAPSGACARRCAPRRCAGWARCPTCSPSNR